MPLKMSFAKWRPFCLGLNVLNVLTHVFILSDAVINAVHFIHISSFVLEGEWIESVKTTSI